MTKPPDTASLPRVQLQEFEGPLDLLLEEVRRQNVTIENVAMAPIVARFLEYIHTAAERNLNLDMDWLHMAATLIHWKSRALLPPETPGQPASDPIRDDLVKQLLAHRQTAAAELARRRALEETMFSRGFETPETAALEPEPPSFVSVWDLIQQARELAGWVEEHRQDRRHWDETLEAEAHDVTVGEMIEYLQDQLAGKVELDAVSLLEGQSTESRRSCLFLGMLEMARNQQLELIQEEAFGPLSLRRTSSL
jgi:segregation and condensation protein A